MDLRVLREQTAADHDRTEAAVPLMAEGLTLDAYAGTLERMYGFVRGWECWAASHVPDDLRELLEARQRSGLLAADLRFFHRAPPARLAELPAGAVSREDFLGSMYVIEGSTLGGQYLAAHLQERFGLRNGEGYAYFAGYGARTGSMWNGFRAHLAALPETSSGDVIAAAKRMFAAFERWMLAPTAEPGESRTEREQATHA